jgi:hypothetical protein
VASGLLTLAIVLVTENGKLFRRQSDFEAAEIAVMH